MEGSSKVRLAVYDLSNGFAAAMSESMLGQKVDGIWHTGLLAFGSEYFFGGGIQVLPIGDFSRGNGLEPVRILDIGVTQISADVFHEYLHSISPRFTMETYDLLQNNCNNFSHECSQFLTGCGIPNYIIDLPKIVFATPAGAMLKPMIESMQRGVRGAARKSFDPFVSSSQAQQVQPPPQIQTQVAPGIVNCAASQGEASTCSDEPIIFKPVVSGCRDNGLILALGEKLKSFSRTDPSTFIAQSLAPHEVEMVTVAVEILKSRPAYGSVSFDPRLYTLLLRLMMEPAQLQVACLYFLRLMILYEHRLGDMAEETVIKIVEILGSCSKKSSTGCPGRFMAICLLANYYSRGHVSSCGTGDVTLDVSLDVATSGIACGSHASKDVAGNTVRPEIRQVSAALMLNIVITQLNTNDWLCSNGDNTVDAELHPHLVQILCCCFEDILHETDYIVLHRRMSVVHNILFKVPSARRLFVEVGFFQSLIELRNTLNTRKSCEGGPSPTILSAVDMTLQLLA